MRAQFNIGCDEGDIAVYDFVCFLIKEEETADLHCLASKLLNIPFCHFEEAYQRSLSHIGRGIEICPDDVSLLEALFFFNDIPEKLIPDNDVKWIAERILKKHPESKAAQYYLTIYKK